MLISHIATFVSEELQSIKLCNGLLHTMCATARTMCTLIRILLHSCYKMGISQILIPTSSTALQTVTNLMQHLRVVIRTMHTLHSHLYLLLFSPAQSKRLSGSKFNSGNPVHLCLVPPQQSCGLPSEEMPINEFTTGGYFSCAFPTLFPTRAADFSGQRQNSVTIGNYFKHFVMSDDS